MRKLTLAAVLVVSLVLVAPASAHTLSKSRAQSIASDFAYEVFLAFEDPELIAHNYYGGPCVRRSRHKVGCAAGVIVFDSRDGQEYDCWWISTVRFRSSTSRRVRVHHGDLESCDPTAGSASSAERREVEASVARAR